MIQFYFTKVSTRSYSLKSFAPHFNLHANWKITTSVYIKVKFVLFYLCSLHWFINYWPLWCRSVLRGGFTAIFMFGFCIYFYAKSNMRGLLQLSFFFGYNACICYAFFLMLGTISFRASLVFVNHIYHAVKNEWTFLHIWLIAFALCFFLHKYLASCKF